ncbi:hypothetical protein [Synechococcus elongatus]|uniref:Uncharacterized protein n=2 Tax=Synechococcus elongatus TaxID=32046 RepID=Q31L52_SYNE7|nr:hypothetical protein [Synechococcus elongatus]ABB58217.1 conserved hypothetical protein [Synechococcus elongatus PCC 7942 = FACHB-805]AJD57309.1 hypothetical protein M744_05410 [Synechococcus elongatus UTEX 2973]MBD2586940.1 hypothetical protein [Synechococcus elongatus FACHB-242]MBD2688011.1 hypothetical protein [Synechococcus elongatus FACHB-1061]MBD2706278.1 hypothetical protein [Synechococcus elongatus PCC 7942 = FACHB-805]
MTARLLLAYPTPDSARPLSREAIVALLQMGLSGPDADASVEGLDHPAWIAAVHWDPNHLSPAQLGQRILLLLERHCAPPLSQRLVLQGERQPSSPPPYEALWHVQAWVKQPNGLSSQQSESQFCLLGTELNQEV